MNSITGIEYRIYTNSPNWREDSTLIMIPSGSIQKIDADVIVPTGQPYQYHYKVIKPFNVGSGYLHDKDGNGVSMQSLAPKVGDVIIGGEIITRSFPTGLMPPESKIFTQKNIIIAVLALVLILLINHESNG